MLSGFCEPSQKRPLSGQQWRKKGVSGAAFPSANASPPSRPFEQAHAICPGKCRVRRLGASRGESSGCCGSRPLSCGWGSWEVPDATELPRGACPVCETIQPAIPASLTPTFAGTFDLGPLSNVMLFTTRLSTFGALDAERGALSPPARLSLVLTHICPLSSARYADLATSR